jgi:general stress protein 26
MKVDFLQEYNRIMDETNKIALATSVDDIPNVRVVNFCNKPQNEGVLYLSSRKNLPKTLEFSKNNIVLGSTKREGL